MGLSISNLFNKLFGKKNMRIIRLFIVQEEQIPMVFKMTLCLVIVLVIVFLGMVGGFKFHFNGIHMNT